MELCEYINKNDYSSPNKKIEVKLIETNTIIDMLKLLGNGSSKANYEYSDEDVRKIFTAIERETKNARAKFNGSDNQKEERFTLE